MILSRERLDALYDEWNRPEYISPDPLETLDSYDDAADREVAALVAGSMAYGRVNSLLPPLKRVLSAMGASPRDYVLHRSEAEMRADLDGVVYRFARPHHLAALLAGVGSAVGRLGSLEAAFLIGYRQTVEGTSGADAETAANRRPCDAEDEWRASETETRHGASGSTMSVRPAARHRMPGDVAGGLLSLAAAVRAGAEGDPGHLLTDPARGSACKRLLLFLRWMVRRDAVDPGGWDSVRPADLLLPLDTWTYRIALRAGWTTRRSANLATVREASSALAELNPEDPIRYDFALSRFGIRSGLNLDVLFE